MAYQAAKRMTLAGVKVKPGQRLDEGILIEMPLGKIDSLRRVGYIIEVPDAIDTPKLSKSQERRHAAQKKGRKAAVKTKDEEAAQVEPSPEETPVEGVPSDGDDTAVTSDPVAST